jgi:viroplasmin and RNaseH domain-containing protein
VVCRGWVPGVYHEWEDCQKQVHKFSGNNYKGYATREEAVATWRNHSWEKNRMKMLVMILLLLTVIAGGFYLFLV